jgi:protein-tyrosine-phosphatase
MAKEAVEDSPNPEREDEGYELCLCGGNVLRSQVAEAMLRLLGIRANSAAVGDISRQQIQGVVPDEVIELAKLLNIDLMGNKIKRVTSKMLKNARHILVFCSEDQLTEDINPSDPRVRIMHVKDPPMGNLNEYKRAMLEVLVQVLLFAEIQYGIKASLDNGEWVRKVVSGWEEGRFASRKLEIYPENPVPREYFGEPDSHLMERMTESVMRGW